MAFSNNAHCYHHLVNDNDVDNNDNDDNNGLSTTSKVCKNF